MVIMYLLEDSKQVVSRPFISLHLNSELQEQVRSVCQKLSLPLRSLFPRVRTNAYSCVLSSI